MFMMRLIEGSLMQVSDIKISQAVFLWFPPCSLALYATEQQCSSLSPCEPKAITSEEPRKAETWYPGYTRIFSTHNRHSY